MATLRVPLLNHTVRFDESGDVYLAPAGVIFALTNARNQMYIVMAFPTGSDVGLEVSFEIPADYVGTPKIVCKGILDGTPANTLAFGAKQVSVAASEAGDVAYETEDLANNSTWTGYADEDMFELSITLTPASAYVAGDEVLLSFYRDDSVDNTTFDFSLSQLFFEYNNA